MNSLAAAVAARLSFVNKNLSLDVEGKDDSVTWFLHQAIGALRKYFSSLKEGGEIDSQILIDIMDMYKASYYTLRIDAGRPHMRIFNTLVDRVSVNSQDIRCRDVWNLREVIDVVSANYPPPSASTLASGLSENATNLQCCSPRSVQDSPGSMAVGFEGSLEMFGGDLATLVQAVVIWAREAQQIFQSDQQAEEILAKLYSTANDLLMSMLWLPPPSPTVLIGEQRVNITVYDCRVPCVRFALVLWLLYAMNHTATLEASRVLLPKLEDTFNNVIIQVVQNGFELPPSQQHIFLWIATVCVLAEEHINREEQSFTARTMEICGQWYITHGTQLSAIVQRFLYFESVQGKSLRGLVEKLDLSW